MRGVTPLTVGLSTFALVAIALFAERGLRLPGNNQGFQPVQPIAYSHRLHAGELGTDCLYCHSGAQTSRHAGVPSAQVCMNCHKVVTAAFDRVIEEKQLAEAEKREPRPIVSDELRKLYRALGLNDALERDPSIEPRPVQWVRVHEIPDYVYFDHRVHVTRGVACQTCHGLIQTMERVRQESDLSMGWCVNCHREQQATTDCSACHY